MNLKVFFTMPLAFIMMLVSLVFSPKTEGIAVIYVGHYSGFAMMSREYKIDLARKNLWEHSRYGLQGDLPRNEKSLFEGFRFAGRLEDAKIAAFRAAAAEYGFGAWEGEYEYDPGEDGPPMPPTDGPSWHIEIVFSDGTRKSAGGYHAWPDHWAEMRQAFEALTGLSIL